MSVKSRGAFCRRGTLGELCRVLLGTLLCVVCCVRPASAQTLRHVQVLFRHADRTPLNGYPTCPFGPEDWPNGYAQLTQRGMRQARDLGKFLRARYDGFLNTTYIADELNVQSTDRDRTLASAATLLAGLYPPQGFQVWDPEIAWQPIPVHTQPYDDDFVLATPPCPLLDKMQQEVLETSDDAIKFFSENKEMLEYVKEKAGWESPTFLDFVSTYDPIVTMLAHPEQGIEYPEWATPDVVEFLTTLVSKYYLYSSYTQEMRVLTSGSFIQMLTSRMQNVVRDATSTPTKLSLYAVHDTMLVSFLIAAGMWEDGKEPPYASAIIYELHEIAPDSFTVRILFKNDTVTNPEGEPTLMTVEGCEADCPLERFLQLMEPNTYKGTTEEKKRECNMEIATSSPGVVVAISMLAAGFVVAVLVVIILVLKSRSSRNRYNSL